MALSSVQAALNQYNANAQWHLSQASATLALEAVRYLLINRAQKGGSQGDELSFESLTNEKAALEKFLGATAPRSFGRRRIVSASFGRDAIQ